MVYFLENESWRDLGNFSNSTKAVQEHLDVDEISHVEKLAEYIGFGFDVWTFIDPLIETQRGEKILIHFTDQNQAQEAHERMLESL